MVFEDIIVALAGIKPHTLKKISENISSSVELINMPIEQLLSLEITPSKAKKILSRELKIRAEKECEFIFKNDVSVISIYDKRYPTYLRECIDAPFLLYVRGDMDFTVNCEKYLSVIGTRRSTPYGEGIGKKIISDLAVYYPDTVIVSGLSYGIDTIAHEAALSSGLKTIAVLPTGLDNIQPSSNFILTKRIIDAGGALISEFPSDSPVFKYNFLQRNRIVAGISVGTLVVETPQNGGTMLTASLAVDYNRELFAIPGRTFDNSYKGCNNLIKSSKAQLVDSAEDIEYYLAWERKKPNVEMFYPDLVGAEKAIYNCFEQHGELTAEQIMESTELSATEFHQAITMLEIKGLIKAVRGRLYIRIGFEN